jgi:uncharacterized membrane protein YdjX (TVP38/TMEM64 family)
MAVDVSQKRNAYLKPILILGFLAVMITFYASGILDFLTLESIKENRAELLAYVSANFILSLFMFIGLYIGVVVFSQPVASLMTLIGGFLFGAFIGGVAVVISATIGATLLFLLARTTFGAPLRAKAGQFYQKVATEMEANAFQYMLFIRLAPIMPFFIANILPSLFNIRVRDFIVTTFLGIIPGTFVYAYLGRNLGTIDTLGDLVSTEVLLGLFGLGFLSLIPVILKKLKVKP